MTSIVASLAAAVLYLLTAMLLIRGSLAEPVSPAPSKVARLRFGFLAVALHAVALYHGIVTSQGLDFGVFNAASLVAWLIALLLLVGALTRPLDNLVIVLLPVAAVALALEVLLPSHRVLPAEGGLGLRLHVIFSIVAYSLLSIAVLQAIMLALAEHQLKHKRPRMILQFLPPLATMETLMFQILGIGFLLLSLSLGSGLVFLDDMFAQHLAHKTILSIAAWVIFAILLAGRHYLGWRGRIAVRATIAGFLLLMLGYFGSKVVLELILERV